MNALDVAYVGLAALSAPWWARKVRGSWRERFGHAPALPEKTGRRLMIHAVSVGEVNALRALIPMLSGRVEIVLTAGTDTGTARAVELYGATPGVHVRRYPLDFSRCVRRFLDAARPDAVALVELELWPNFVSACRARGVPVCVINGRLSERSFAGYRRGRALIGRTFAALEFAAVQDGDYAARFEAMGVKPNACLVTGSMKFDVGAGAGAPDPAPAARTLAASMGIDPARPLVVAGSTAPEEHALLHAAVSALGNEGARGRVQLLCAPRRPEWFDGAAADLPGCVRRSATRGMERTPVGADRFLLDSIGELRAAYALADVVVVGRSFGALFGSDPIEPITLGKPVVIGPAVSDFRHIVATLEKAGGLRRATRETLAAVLRELVENAAARAEVARRGMACVESQRGASERHAALLLSVAGAG